MSGNKTFPFKTKNQGANFWIGFAKQPIDFQHALGELIDNSLSGALPKDHGVGRLPVTIELTIKENLDDSVTIQVADNGAGVPFIALTGDDNIFNIGYKGSNRGFMNEHGFGLKNALSLITSGFQNEFTFISKHYKEKKIYEIKGPINPDMEANVVDDSLWNKDIDILKNRNSGVKVFANVKREYFNSIYNRANLKTTFEVLVSRLAEHLGVMYCYYIDKGNEIHFRYKSKGAPGWTKKELPSIKTPFLVNHEVKKVEYNIEVEHNGKIHNAKYITGILDKTITDKTRKDFPFPLKIHYQGSNARCGVTLVVRDRVLKTGFFREIWPEYAGDVSYNNFLAELVVGDDFSTTSAKTDMDPHSEIWRRLIEKLQDDQFKPIENPAQQSEEKLRKRIIKSIENVKSLKPTKKTIWVEGAEIDIYWEEKGKSYFIETKAQKAIVLDLYQLVCYWDGLVDEGKNPVEGTLVAPEFAPGIKLALKHINSLNDRKNKKYKIKIKNAIDYSL